MHRPVTIVHPPERQPSVWENKRLQFNLHPPPCRVLEGNKRKVPRKIGIEIDDIEQTTKADCTITAWGVKNDEIKPWLNSVSIVS
jgi:hypothetical protein